MIGSAYSLTNNIGIVIPSFAGFLVCMDYSNGTLRKPYKYAVWFIPGFCSNFFNLNSLSMLSILGGNPEEKRGLMFAESMLSYLFFGIVNTAAGMIIFAKRDIR